MLSNPRLIQLTARVLTLALTALAVKLGVENPEETWSIGEWASSLAALLLALADVFWLHRITQQKVVGEAVKKLLTPKELRALPVKPPTTPLVLLAALVVFSTPGCSATPTQRYASAVAALDLAQRTMIVLVDQKVMDDQDILAADYYVQTARSGIAVMKVNLPQGGGNFDEAAEVVAAVLRKLQDLNQESESRRLNKEKPHASRRGPGPHRTVNLPVPRRVPTAGRPQV